MPIVHIKQYWRAGRWLKQLPVASPASTGDHWKRNGFLAVESQRSVSSSYSLTLTHAVSSLHLCYFPLFFFLTFLDFFVSAFCLHTQMIYLVSRKFDEYFPWQLYWERGLIGWTLKFLSISCIIWQTCINTLGQTWIMDWRHTVLQVTDKPMKVKRCILQMMFFISSCQFWPKRKVCMAGYKTVPLLK